MAGWVVSWMIIVNSSCLHYSSVRQSKSFWKCPNKGYYRPKSYRTRWELPTTSCVFLPEEPQESDIESTNEDSDISIEDKYDTWSSRKKNAFQRNTPWQVLVEELNSFYTPDYLKRLYYRNEPVEEFGAILTLEGFLSNAFELELEAWNQVSQEFQLEPVTAEDLSFTETMPREMVIERRLFWSQDWGDINKYSFRQAEIFFDIIRTKQKLCLRSGAKSWLEQLNKYHIPIAITTGLDQVTAEEMMQRWELTSVIEALVNREECENLQEELLLAASRIQRAPRFCVVFDNTPRVMVAAHDVTSKAVALLGRYRAYDLKVADMIIRDIDELKVSDMNALFGDVAKDPETLVGGPFA
ncbi:hypothetical protein GpartN1_g3489.t1 [Galdieria partita]|uniref:Uncharacterized protein n=1 Tax=Galdieria partita TaxID=83374 RepID=A0A9C7PVN5_9RHOD|nr:hypothetical protein GpartN1_g3489.t1 [Galdieria partita]